jgi:hypothetical protein
MAMNIDGVIPARDGRPNPSGGAGGSTKSFAMSGRPAGEPRSHLVPLGGLKPAHALGCGDRCASPHPGRPQKDLDTPTARFDQEPVRGS